MNAPGLLGAVREVLAQGEVLLRGLDDDLYTRKVPQVFDAAIGGHYRHSLDHFSCVFEGMERGMADYDARARDARVETDRDCALARTISLLMATEALDDASLDAPFRVRCRVSYAADCSALAESTVGRELMFCVVHAIHHHALIGVMGTLMGLTLPPGFGVAPSTIAHRGDGARRAA